MRQECIDTIETTTAPQASWGQWAKAGITLVRSDALQLMMLLWTWHERSRQRHQMQQLSDHLLKDMGLNKADVENETRKPFWMR